MWRAALLAPNIHPAHPARVAEDLTVGAHAHHRNHRRNRSFLFRHPAGVGIFVLSDTRELFLTNPEYAGHVHSQLVKDVLLVLSLIHI